LAAYNFNPDMAPNSTLKFGEEDITYLPSIEEDTEGIREKKDLCSKN